VCLSYEAKGQVHCSETLVTTNPTINVWDWRTQFWSTNIYTNGGPGIFTSVLSPFHSVDNINLTGISNFAEKDYKPEDGWELIKRNLGNAGETPVTNAYVVFYNKYNSKIRVFFLVTQTFSNTGSSGNASAAIKIYFLNDNSPYQSNLLTTYSTPMLPLDQFRRDINIRTPNIYFNQLPYWLYSEFPVAYDPCTCGRVGKIRIELTLIDAANIEFDLNSVPYQKTITNGQIDSSKDWLTSFTQITNQAEGGLKAAKSTGEAFSKLNDAITKQTKVDLQNKLNASLGEVNQIVNTVGNWAGLIPLAGSSVKSVISLLDYFSAGGKKTTSAAGPAPVMIMNNFKAKGSITSETSKNEITMAIPGSNQSGVDPALIPTYNNTLGVFNLLNTPKVKIINGPEDFSRVEVITYCSNSNIESYVKHRGVKPMYFNIQENIKYVINPAANIDLSRSDIRAAFIIEDCANVFSTNMDVDVANGSVNTFRSAYHPITALDQATSILNRSGRFKITTNDGCSENPNQRIITYTGSYCAPKVYLKIIAKLTPVGSTSTSEDIIFIAKYPVAIAEENTTLALSGGKQDIPEDVVLGDNPNGFFPSFRTALNTISAGAIGNNSFTLSAGQSIKLRPGTVITPNIIVKVGQVYTPTQSLQSLQATPAELSTFCSTTYNIPSRTTPSARTGNSPYELESEKTFFTLFPNPAKDQVTFNYFIDAASAVTLEIVDLQGRSVVKIINDHKPSGNHTYDFDSSNLPSGLYVAVFKSDKLSKKEKLLIIR